MNDVTALPENDDPGTWISWTTIQQAIASDPQRSAWVSANAGSGKTHVLTQRVIRLLLAGARPSAILCLTYTKAAASEMSNRVFARLADWAVLPDEELSKRIGQIEGEMPDRVKLAEARRLFAKALETPGGLKIQTIHAFCEALLHQFPLEANVAGHFSVLDDRAAATLLADARRSLLTATAPEEDAASVSFCAAALRWASGRTPSSTCPGRLFSSSGIPGLSPSFNVPHHDKTSHFRANGRVRATNRVPKQYFGWDSAGR